MPESKQTVVSFRVDHHLAEVLNRLPDKSAFIREAILRRFHTVCPFCQGRGVMPKVIADWLGGRIPDSDVVECQCCHYRFPEDLVAQELAQGPRDEFICPHCADHAHAH